MIHLTAKAHNPKGGEALSGYKGAAIQAFATMERRRHSLHKAECDVNRIVIHVAQEDMNDYVQKTEQIARVRTAICKVCTPSRVWATP